MVISIVVEFMGDVDPSLVITVPDDAVVVIILSVDDISVLDGSIVMSMVVE